MRTSIVPPCVAGLSQLHVTSLGGGCPGTFGAVIGVNEVVAASPAVAVRTLGDFELSFDGRPVQRWKAGKARSLLQFLLLRPGRPVPRTVLYAALWPDASWSKDSSSLKVAVHMLRAVLEQGGSGLRLLTRDSGYVLEVDTVFVDFEEFARLADEAHAAQMRGDRPAATARYRQAVDLYHGDFLPDVPYDWAATHREWLRSRLLCALAFLTETDIRHGDHAGVIRWCRRMLEVEPFHEETYRALILVHAHLGHLAQVRRWYRLCVAQLRENLQVGPDLATQRVYSRALRGEFTGRPIQPSAWQQHLQPAGDPSLLQHTA
jgi:DNA-binding SARP family transcriptional activator